MTEQNNQRMFAQRICLDLAMQACLPPLKSWRVAWVLRKAGPMLDPQDPLRIALEDFAARFPDIRRDPDVLAEAGGRLFGAVRQSTWPADSGQSALEE